MYNREFTPEQITVLGENDIFVFGSNLEGRHAGGAARLAHRSFGAVMGQGVGLQGNSYAIPTMQGGVETIRPYVDEFVAFAKAHSNLSFYVTKIGCGIAGFSEWDIAPLFADAIDVENILIPQERERAIKRISSLIDIVLSPELREYDTHWFREDAISSIDGIQSHMTCLSLLAWKPISV